MNDGYDFGAIQALKFGSVELRIYATPELGPLSCSRWCACRLSGQRRIPVSSRASKREQFREYLKVSPCRPALSSVTVCSVALAPVDREAPPCKKSSTTKREIVSEAHRGSDRRKTTSDTFAVSSSKSKSKPATDGQARTGLTRSSLFSASRTLRANRPGIAVICLHSAVHMTGIISLGRLLPLPQTMR